MKKVYYGIITVLVLIGAGIGIKIFVLDKNVDSLFKKGAVVSGFIFNELASAAETNGYIYAVNRSNPSEVIDVVTIKVPQKSFPVDLPQDSSFTVSSVGGFFTWLEKGKPGASDTIGNVKLSSKLKVKLNFQDASKVKTSLLEASGSIEEAITQIREKLNKILNVSDYDFYLITETIKAKKLEYTFDKSTSDDESFKASLKKLATVNPKLSLSDQRNTTLGFLDTAYRVVLYRALPLSVNHSLTGEYNVEIAEK